MITYLQIHNELYQQTDRMAMDSALSPVISNVYTGNFKKVVLEQSNLRSKMWLRYIDGIFTSQHGKSIMNTSWPT
jgi:hypothetical protein